jgi:hypothetical protein
MGDRAKVAKRTKLNPNAGGAVQPRVRNPAPADGAGPEPRARRKVARRKEGREPSPALSGGAAAESQGLHLPGGPPEDGGFDLAVVPNSGPRRLSYEELLRFHELHTKGAAPGAVAPTAAPAALDLPVPQAATPSFSPVRATNPPTRGSGLFPDAFPDRPFAGRTACASLSHLLT